MIERKYALITVEWNKSIFISIDIDVLPWCRSGLQIEEIRSSRHPCCDVLLDSTHNLKREVNRTAMTTHKLQREAKRTVMGMLNKLHVKLNSLWPSDTIWRQRSGSTLAQVMACCWTAPSHYLNQCWLTISEVQWNSSQGNFTQDTSAIDH